MDEPPFVIFKTSFSKRLITVLVCFIGLYRNQSLPFLIQLQLDGLGPHELHIYIRRRGVGKNKTELTGGILLPWYPIHCVWFVTARPMVTPSGPHLYDLLRTLPPGTASSVGRLCGITRRGPGSAMKKCRKR